MVMSLFDARNIKGEFGSMIVEPAVRRIPKTESRRERLREELRTNDLANGIVVSEDFRYTLIILNAIPETSDEEIMQTITGLLDKYPGHERVSLFGQPYMRVEANEKIARDLFLLLPVGLLIMLLFLWISFREKRGVLLPISVVIFSIGLSMALIPLFGWQMSIIGILVPIMMLAIANNYGVHFITRYQELNAEYPKASMKQIVTEVTLYLRKPVFLTGMTTIVGIMGLVTHVILPAKQMGIVSAIGVGFALLLSLVFIPAVMSHMKKGKIHRTYEGNHVAWFDRLLLKISGWVTGYPKKVLLFSGIIFAVAIAGFFQLQVASDFDDILPENHPYNQALKIANAHFGGTKIIKVMFEGDIKDPALLKRMDRYAHELDSLPEIGRVTSIASVIRIMSRALNDPGDSLYDRIPDTREAVAQYLELYSMSGDPEDFEELVDFDYTKALMSIQYKAGDMKTMNRIEGRVRNLVRDDPDVTLIGGYSLFEKELSRAVTIGQIYSLLFAFLAIMVLLVIIFRSLTAGLLGSLPLMLAVLFTFGIMGWSGLRLNIVTALLSSISIGLGVDYTIHMFWRIKSELKSKSTFPEAVSTSIQTVGRGITINALSVIIGFAVLFFSAFPIIRSFALLIILSIAVCLVCALVLIPAVCMLNEPKFLLKNNKN